MSRAVAAGMTTQDATATAHAIFQSVHKQLSSSVVSTGSSRATTGQSILGNACVAAAGSALTSSKSLPIVSKMPASMTANNSTSSSSGSLLPATMRSFVCTAAPRVIGVCQETDDYSDLESEEDGYSASALSSSDVCSETDYTDEDDDDSLMSSSSFSSTSSSTHLRQQLIHQEVDSVTASANQLATLLNGDDGKDDVEEEDLYNNISASFNEAVEPPSQQTSGEQASSPTSSSSGYCRKIINPLFEKIPTLPSFVSQTSSLSAAAAAASRPGSFIHPQHRQHTLLASSCKIIKKHQSALSSALRSVVAGNTNHSTAAFSFDEDCVDDCNRYNHTCSNHGSSSPSLLRPNPIFAKPNTGFPVGPPSTTSSIAASTVVPHLIHFVDRELSESLRRNLGVERRRLPLGMCLNGSEQK